MPIVRFAGTNDQIEVGKGSNLRRSLLMHGITPHHGVTKKLNCLGMGLCGSCWIEVVEGMENLSAPSKMEQLPVPHKAISGARRLSCQTRVYGDCVIRLQDSQQPAE